MIERAEVVPAPISVPAAEAWDNDGAGLWSTFALQVGTPAQTVRAIASTAGYETWVVVGQGCPATYGIYCATNRAGIFAVNESTSWENIGLYQLDLETNLGLEGNGQYGYDTVSMGYSGTPKLDHVVVAGMAAPDFWLGIFGLDPAPSNFSSLADPQPSYLWTLRNQSMIPSTSWGYTAGAYYRYNKVQGSLTLGGYDQSRFGSDNVTFSMYGDVSQRFLADLRAIKYTPTGLSTTTTATTLMSDTITIYIDSTVPYLWLPTTVCDAFASAFSLRYNETSQIYMVNDTTHTFLTSMNPNVTFTLANTAGEVQDFVFPYNAFDLTASFPAIPNDTVATRYFPLKRAANDTQYTLGRVFLQEAYMIADFDRLEFTLAPCIWPSNFASDGIRAIHPPTNSTNDPGSAHHKSSTPIGAIAGPIIGVVALITIVYVAYRYFIVNPRQKRALEAASFPDEEKKDISGDTPTTTNLRTLSPAAGSELDGQFHGAEMEGHGYKNRTSEMAVPVTPHELASREGVMSELDSPGLFEMPAREPVGIEVSGSRLETAMKSKQGRPFSWECEPASAIGARSGTSEGEQSRKRLLKSGHLMEWQRQS